MKSEHIQRTDIKDERKLIGSDQRHSAN